MTDQRSQRWHDRFPDLYQKLTPQQQDHLSQTLGSHALAGMDPDRETVSDLIDRRTGVIDKAEYDRRAAARAAEARAAAPSAE
ncbi:hypothetical protein [Nocardia sp. NPDC050710]|uniref:antitoxin VbhA family protein n=1 Tax=Nocardia sp. NPDC050710 TaxID=3157220 RepID=UPI0034002EA9